MVKGKGGNRLLILKGTKRKGKSGGKIGAGVSVWMENGEEKRRWANMVGGFAQNRKGFEEGGGHKENENAGNRRRDLALILVQKRKKKKRQKGRADKKVWGSEHMVRRGQGVKKGGTGKSSRLGSAWNKDPTPKRGGHAKRGERDTERRKTSENREKQKKHEERGCVGKAQSDASGEPGAQND